VSSRQPHSAPATTRYLGVPVDPRYLCGGGYADNYVGNLCTASIALEGGYEPGAWWEYQRPGPFAPEVEPALVTTALGLAQEFEPAPG
jgi:hypothetical protein